MNDTSDDIDDILLRTRAVEDEIEATRRRIDGLLGVGANASMFSRRWKERFVAEVRHELPAIELPAAHAALVEAMHRETGLVGAVRRRGDELEWKPFFEHPGTRGLEVHVEGDATSPTLRLRGSASSGARQALFLTGGMLAAIGATVGAIVLGLPGLGVGLVALVAIFAFMLVGARIVRGGAERSLSALARRLGEQMTSARAKVRVDPSVDADEADAALVFEATQARESRRGVS